MPILKRMFRGFNNPAVPLSSAYDMLTSGETSKTGVTVNETNSLGLPAFWKGVNLISRAVGKTQIFIKRREGDSLVADKLHPAWYLLRKLPSGSNYDIPMTAFIFKQTIQAHVLLTGNGYAYIVRDTMANPIALILLDPSCVIPIIENGRLVYLITLGIGEVRRIEPINMLHIKGLGYDGIIGYSIIEMLKDSLGLNLAYQINQSVFFRNGMKPGWIIEVPWKFKDEDAVNTFRKKLGKVHGGLEKAHIPAVLENGAKATVLNISQEDAQFLQSREFDLRMLANILFLPSSKLNDVAKVAYNSLEQENQSLLDEAFEPWFVLWEEELEYKLLTEQQKQLDTHEIIFERRKLVQTPFKDLVEGCNKAILAGWMGRDEARNWFDLNPIPEGKGKPFFIPVNVTETDKEKEPVDNQGDDTIDEERISKARGIVVSQIEETVERLFERRIVLASKRKSANPKQFMSWVLDEVFDANRQAFIQLLEPKVMLLRLFNGKTTDTNTTKLVDDYLIHLRNDFNNLAGMVNETSLVMELDRMLVRHGDMLSHFVSTLVEKG